MFRKIENLKWGEAGESEKCRTEWDVIDFKCDGGSHGLQRKVELVAAEMAVGTRLYEDYN